MHASLLQGYIFSASNIFVGCDTDGAILKQVARKKFVDDFSTLAVEKCLLEPLADIFCPRVVDRLTDDTVEAIAAEDESSKLERSRLEVKVATLRSALLQLHRLDRHNVSGEIYRHDI